MPKNRSRQRSVVRASGQIWVPVVIASNLGTFKLSPTVIAGRLLALSDAFMLWRFTHVRISFVQGARLTLGYSSALLTAAPTNEAETSELDRVAVCHASQVTISRLVLGRNVLLETPAKWFRSGTAYDDNFENQGVFYLYESTTPDTVRLFMEWSCEFCDPAATGDTLSARRRLRLQDEDAVLVHDEEDEKSESSLTQALDDASLGERRRVMPRLVSSKPTVGGRTG